MSAPVEKPKNDRLLRALARQPVDATPVWIMRQAGRYLPEYRETRARAGSFLKLCSTPELACEVTLQPLERFSLDAAILFSDILTIPNAMGLGLEFVEGEGPSFQRPVQTVRAIMDLGVPDPETELRYVMDAVLLIRKELDNRVPLIGFSGSPWTLASYMVEGQAPGHFRKVKGLMYGEPEALHHLLDILARSVAAYLEAQMKAGAQVLMIFDTWGGVLTTAAYEEFSLRYMHQILALLPTENRPPVILFSKGGGGWLESMAATGCDALGLDWSMDMGTARSLVGGQVALQGNLDPALLEAPDEVIRTEVGRVLASYGGGAGHIFNLGHGIQPWMKPEKMAVLVDAVHELSRQYHP